MLYPKPHRIVTAEEFAWLIELHKRANNISNVRLITYVKDPYKPSMAWHVGELLIGVSVGCASQLLTTGKPDCYIYQCHVTDGYNECFTKLLLESVEVSELTNPNKESRDRFFTLGCYSINKNWG